MLLSAILWVRHSNCSIFEDNICCVTDVPVVQPFSFVKNLKVGMKTSVPCVASGAEPFQFKWTKNGLPISSSHIEVTTSDTDSNLRFKPIKNEDEGEYACLVKNPVGSASHSAILSIERKFLKCLSRIESSSLSCQQNLHSLWMNHHQTS